MFQEYRAKTGQDMQHTVQVQVSLDQQIIALYSGRATPLRVDANQPDRIFILKLQTSGAQSAIASSSGSGHVAVIENRSAVLHGSEREPASSSGGVHPAVIKTRLAALQDFCAASTEFIDEEKTKLTYILLKPVHVMERTSPADGTQLSGPIDVADSVRLFDDTLMLIKNAGVQKSDGAHLAVDDAAKLQNSDGAHLAVDDAVTLKPSRAHRHEIEVGVERSRRLAYVFALANRRGVAQPAAD